MSHIAKSDKGARKQVSRSEKSDVMPCWQKKKKKSLEKKSKKKKKQSTLCFTHQELLVIGDGAAERANAIASNCSSHKVNKRPPSVRFPPSVTDSRSPEPEGMRNGGFLKRKERNTPLW